MKTVIEKVTHKADKAMGWFIGNKIADKIVKQKAALIENLKDVEEIIILPEKREEILNELGQVL